MMTRSTLLALMTSFMLGSIARADGPAPPGLRLVWNTLAPLPDPCGVAGAFAGVAAAREGDGDAGHGVLVVAGGANFPDRPPWEGGTKAWHAGVYVLPAPDGRWSAANSLPRPLGYGVSASFGGRVWCVGGGDADAHVRSTTALTWDAATHTVRIETDALPPLPQPMALGSGVLVGSRLFIAGGLASPTATEALGRFCSIDLAAAPDRRYWREHPGCPGAKRILPALGALGDTIYLASGAELVADLTATVTRRFLTDAYAFDLSTGTWRAIASCPVPLVAAPAPAIPLAASRLAFLPGDDGALFFKQKELAGRHPGFPRRIHVYDAVRDDWHTADAVPDGIRPAVTTPVVPWRDGWIVPSGEVQPGVRSSQIVRLVAEPAGE